VHRRCCTGRERGAVVVEYAAVLALVVVAAAIGLSGVNDAATAVLERQAECVARVAPSACPPRGGVE
jgi:Flp pilus assembly pilin Flp